MKESRRAQLVVGAFVLAALGVFAFMAFKLGGMSLRPRVRGSAVFDDVSGLVPGARVSVAGVVVGSVRELSIEGGRARVAFVIYEGHGLTDAAQAEIRARSLLGEKYLAILPADRGALLSDGFTLQARPPAPSIDDVMARLAPAIDALPVEELAEDLRSLDRFLKEAIPRLEKASADLDLSEVTRAARALREILDAERAALHRTLQATAGLAEAYQPRAKDTAANLEDAARNLKIVSDRLAAIDGAEVEHELDQLQASLEKLPGTLERLDRVLVMLEKLAPAVDRISGVDRDDVRRLLQEEGVRIRFSEPPEAP